MANKIASWRVLREDGKNIAWVNDRFVGVVSDEQVAAYEAVCPTQDAPDLAKAESEKWFDYGVSLGIANADDDSPSG